LGTQGITAQYSYAFETEWNDIVDLVDQLRINKRRQIFLLGSESYYRKIVCASIVVEANKGISWLSKGQWRDNWYKTSDALQDSYRQWVEEDAKKEDLLLALDDFVSGWNQAGATDEERYLRLQPAYSTEQGEVLETVAQPAEGEPFTYHDTHKKYHAEYRDLRANRNYYDIYMFNTMGNLVYSVYKADDYATNFGTKTNLPEAQRKWQNTQLGEGFRAALANMDTQTLAVTPWSPYGPTNGAMESFMCVGIKEADGTPLGVFAARMPPEVMSVEDSQPECTFAAVTEAFDGAINFVGLGTPIAQDMEAQTPCFAGRTAKSFLQTLDFHLKNGYPTDDEASKVPQPFDELKAHPADGACVFAYTVKYLLESGFTMDQITSKTPEVYVAFVGHMKNSIDFMGASGRVQFKGNDKPAYLAVTQIQAGDKVLVGTCTHNGTRDLSVNGGPSNASWKPANPDPIPPEADFPYFVFQIVLPILCICCPALAACVRNF